MIDHEKTRPLSWAFHPLEFSLVGFCDTGKTTLMSALVEWLSQNAKLRLAYVKHDAHRFQMDREGKDTYRVAKAGAAAVYISNDRDRAYLGFGSGPQTIPHLEFLDCDAVLVEGFKGSSLPKLCLLDPKLEILSDPGLHELPPIAYAGPWTEAPAGLPGGLPYFPREKVAEIANFILGCWQNSIAKRRLRGLVLTGGGSSRMGRDKAQLAYHGGYHSEWTYTLLKTVCDEVHISCRADQSELPGRAGLPQIHDRHLELGPLGGILSAMDAHPADSWVVCACDLPFVTKQTLDSLVSRRNPWRYATSYQDKAGLPEPLLAIYEPKSRARLYQFLAMGYDYPRKMLISSAVELLGLPPQGALDNINEPFEFEEAIRALSR